MPSPSFDLVVDHDAPEPVYRQIADQVRALVARGRLRPGDELPSVRELGAALGVNLNTVARAWRLLAEEGLVDLRHGSGAVVRAAAPVPTPLLDDDSRRRLDDLLSRWVLRGADRAAAEAALRDAVDRFFPPRVP